MRPPGGIKHSFFDSVNHQRELEEARARREADKPPTVAVEQDRAEFAHDVGEQAVARLVLVRNNSAPESRRVA